MDVCVEGGYKSSTGPLDIIMSVSATVKEADMSVNKSFEVRRSYFSTTAGTD